MLGLDGWRALSSADPVDHILLAALAERVNELREVERRALAVEIVNALAQALK